MLDIQATCYLYYRFFLFDNVKEGPLPPDVVGDEGGKWWFVQCAVYCLTHLVIEKRESCQMK